MIRLENENIILRGLEPDDLSFFLRCENDPSLWRVCDTRIPFSKYVLERILEATTSDIYAEKQLRLVIESKAMGQPVGFLDFYGFSPLHHRSWIGIVIYEGLQRNKGYGREALETGIGYAFRAWDLHQVAAGISAENEASRRLFEKTGFTPCGRYKDWLCIEGEFTDQINYQLLKSDFDKTHSL